MLFICNVSQPNQIIMTKTNFQTKTSNKRFIYFESILKQARVHNKLRFMNSPKGSLMGDELNMNTIVSSIFCLVRLKASYIPKIRLLACLIPKIAMKKTLKLGFGRLPQHN